MEKSNISNFSAYAKVTQKFLSICEEEGVNPKDCLLAICRMFDITPKSDQVGSLVKLPIPGPVQLSADQVAEAKRIARKEKATKLGLGPSEVNLTSDEVKLAKKAFRERLQQGESIPLTVSSRKSKKEKGNKGENISPPPSPTQSPQLQKPASSQSGIEGLRSTMKTRLETVKRLTLRHHLAAIRNPTNLHLLAYRNHWVRLQEQWVSFQGGYNTSNMKDPFKDLPDPFKGDLNDYVMKISAGLKTQSSSPRTLVLQNEDGQSFWDKDQPRIGVCPDILVRPVDDKILAIFGAKRNAN